MATKAASARKPSDCATCGKPDAKSICSKCQAVCYCCPACQRADWDLHKVTCTPFMEGVACCDVCNLSQAVIHCCCLCGTLYCKSCYAATLLGNCQGCPRMLVETSAVGNKENFLSLKALADTDQGNKRQSFWCLFVAFEYTDGRNVGKDLTQAKQYAKMAGTLNCGEGYNVLGYIYLLEGDGQEAKKYYEKAAALNCLEAFYSLGQGYYNGEFGGSPDYSATKKWFKRGAQLGNAACCDRLGDMYRETNLKKAAKYYQKGAERGNVNAFYSLGLCYYDGEGVPRSFEQARFWLEKAAAQEENQELAEVARRNLNELSQRGL